MYPLQKFILNLIYYDWMMRCKYPVQCMHCTNSFWIWYYWKTVVAVIPCIQFRNSFWTRYTLDLEWMLPGFERVYQRSSTDYSTADSRERERCRATRLLDSSIVWHFECVFCIERFHWIPFKQHFERITLLFKSLDTYTLQANWMGNSSRVTPESTIQAPRS